MTRTLTIVTAYANETVSERMPVILAPKDQPTWLPEWERSYRALRPANEDVRWVWPVSKRVNSLRNNEGEGWYGVIEMALALPAGLS